MTQYLGTFLMISMVTLGGCATKEYANGALGHDIYGADVSEYEKGKVDFAAKRFGLALQHFKKALIHAPKDAKVLNGVAATYDKMSRFDISKRFYQMALTVDPNSPETLNNFGYSYYMQRKYDVAKILLREAVAKSTNKWTGHANLHLVNQTVESENNKPKGHKADKARHLVRSMKVATIFTPLPVDGGQRRASDSQRGANTPTPVKILQLIRTAARTHTIFTRHHPGITLNPTPNIPVNPFRRSETRAITVPLSSDSIAKIKIATRTAAAPDKSLEPSTHAQQSMKTPEPAKAPAWKHKNRKSVSIIISNGTGRSKMAARMRGHLNTNGYQMMWLGNADNYRKRVTTVFYKEGLRDSAEILAAQLPVAVQLIERSDQRTSLQLELAADLLDFDKELIHQLKKVQTDA